MLALISSPLDIHRAARIAPDRVAGLLGVVGLGTAAALLPPGALPPGCPFGPADLPVLSGDPLLEIWHGSATPHYGARDDIAFATAGDLLFGIATAPDVPGAELEAVIRGIYARILAVVNDAGCPHLLKVANYIPRINVAEAGLERYRHFNAGRQAAFAAQDRALEAAPAACGLGTLGESILIQFLACRQTGTPVENPRQVSAYQYPPEYGRKSPAFSRAMIANLAGERRLFVSGTASIVGHRTLHQGDVQAQTDETIRNLRAVLGRAAELGARVEPDALRLKVYLRHPDDLDAVSRRVQAQLDPRTLPCYLRADICRSDLLVEIEGDAPAR